jgi:predicted MFS family arabinose efflux permease
MATPAALSDDAASLRKDWIKFSALSFLFMFGFSVYSGVFQNFLRDVLHAHELDLGILESTREIPGLLTALTATTLVALAESRVAALGLAVCAIGIGVSGTTTSFEKLVAITVFWSVGFHLFTTMQSPITLALAKGKEGGRHLGRMAGIGGLSTILGLGTARVLSQFVPKNTYEPYFAIAGGSILIAAGLCASLSHHAAGGKRQRLVFRREYGLFYLLTFLEGCRRQIFSIFASFALILVYKQSVDQMLTLQLINAVLIAITAPQIGKMVDKKGERGPLTFYAFGLIVVFLGYAITRRVETLYALFLLDNILFSFSVGFTTYLHRIVRPGEMTPCVAMGVTMNHIAAVTVPVGGAYLWKASGNYQLPFWVGVGIAVVSLFATQKLPHGPVPTSD